MVSFLAVLIIAGLVGMYFRSLASKDLKTMAERGNLAISESYGATIWQKHRQPLLRAQLSPNPQANAEFDADTKAFFAALDTPWVIIYNAAGNAIYATAPSPTPVTDLNRNIADLRVGNEKIRSTLLDSLPDEAQKNNTLAKSKDEKVFVRSLAAINGPSGAELYIETISGITPQWQKLVLLQWVASGGIVTVFFILIWILVLTSKKAEEIIARQHETNTELAAVAASAQAENREKSLFLANISHELRTPLNAIIGFSEIIKNELMGTVQNPSYQAYINDIYNSGVHLLSLINDILDFSKAEAGKLEIEVGEVNANKMIINCMRLVSPRAESGNVKLIDALPKEAVVLFTDNKKFKQVMLNLLSNAVKFTPPGGEVSVTAWPNVGEDSFSFEVKDTGIGIAPKDISRAMSPFGQVDNTLSRKYEGTGLGLPLTKKFIELLGGKFHISSEMNVGTTIRFTLPRQFVSNGEVPFKTL